MIRRIALVFLLMLALTACGSASQAPAASEKTEETQQETKQETKEETKEQPQEEAPEEEAPEKEGEEAMQTGYEQAREEALKALNAMGTPVVEITVKDYGTIKVQLNPEEAPITVLNFVGLVQDGFYDGLTFHRIISGFMIQGGDPLGNGTGGADRNIMGEFAMNGVQNNISHKRGVISMARSMDPDSASSQFFIVHQDSTFLDGQYAGFGAVTEGMEIVDQICEDAKPVDNNGTIPGDAQPVIEKMTVSFE